ncbi:MAG: hypothetical protein KUG65_03195 [Sphingomonadaceae bacterium]|nr:hypothetical protein [Sphingomonadaceae bacterium]
MTETSRNAPATSAPDYEGERYTPSAIHMVRTATMANLTMSQMADQKASILMGAQFVVFTIAIGQADNGQYPLSLLCLAVAAFISAMFSIAAVVPVFNDTALPGQGKNVLFFGVFAQMDEDEFIDEVMHAAQNDGRILSAMLRDIHQNGTVLRRKKFRYLRYAYRSFQIGLVLTILIFLYEGRDAIAALAG